MCDRFPNFEKVAYLAQIPWMSIYRHSIFNTKLFLFITCLIGIMEYQFPWCYLLEAILPYDSSICIRFAAISRQGNMESNAKICEPIRMKRNYTTGPINLGRASGPTGSMRFYQLIHQAYTLDSL